MQPASKLPCGCEHRRSPLSGNRPQAPVLSAGGLASFHFLRPIFRINWRFAGRSQYVATKSARPKKYAGYATAAPNESARKN